MSEPRPDADEVAALFQELCAGDPVARSDFIAAVLDPLASHLRQRHSGADEYACLTAAEDAVLNLLRNPAIYDPTKRGLIGFLRMSAEGDLLNALRKERKHHIQQGGQSQLVHGMLNALRKERKHHTRREPAESVELVPDDGNTSSDTDAADEPSFADPVFAAVLASFTATERAVLDLMRAGERATAAFVPLIGVEHLSEDEQRREVKKVKERIFKRLQRAGGKL